MKAVVWHGDEDVRVDTVEDPRIQEPTDAIVRITSTAICGSDLHLYGAKTPGMKEGDVLGHEPMGFGARGRAGRALPLPLGRPADGLAGGEVRRRAVGPLADGRRLRLGPIGQMCGRIALHLGAERVLGLDVVPERLEMARRHGVEVHDASDMDVADDLRGLTGGRGPDAVIDAVGLESEGNWFAKAAQFLKVKPDRHRALHDAIWSVRRGGTLSIIGVYGGPDPVWPLGELFDRQIQVRMGQANVRQWTDEILPLLNEDDPLGVEDLTTHRLPLEQAPHGYGIFQRKEDGAIKVVLEP